jgi:hypothetical protein
MDNSPLCSVDTADLSPADRLREIAAILARGVMRLTRCRPVKSPSESAAERLDVSDKTVLSVTRG